METEQIPEELKVREQWLMWDSSADSPRRPHWRGDFSVSWTNPDDWHSFEEASEAAMEKESWGIGFVFSNTNDDHPSGIYGALDLDGCVDEKGRPKDWLPSLQPFFDEGAYMEFSPSGGGIHIPLVGFEKPDWWRDVHFTDDEHEGVEAYGKKFFTFTGNKVKNSGDDVAETGQYVENWLIEAYKSITGKDPTKKQSGKFSDSSAGNRGNREEFLDEDDIRDALSHIDPDVDYNTWRDIGFALVDFFGSDHTAYTVFEEWSRGGTKWDSDAEDQAQRIINDADMGGGRTIGTVIHLARERGWSMPTPSPEQPPEEYDSDGEEGEENGWPSWEKIRDIYANPDRTKGLARQFAASRLNAEYSWMFVVESEKLWVYNEDRGYYNPWGEQFLNNLLERELRSHYSTTEAKEIIARIEARHQTHREELNARTREEYYVCVGNGVVNLSTGELKEHHPSYKFTRGLKWDYNPAKADPEAVTGFLDDITKREEDRDTILDHLAHGLMPGHPYRAFVMMYGPGSNGKTQLGQLLRGFVGEDNAASVELQDLTGDDNFATGGLPGAFINVGDDVSVNEIRDVSILKSLTGGGTIRANEKYEKQYEFQNEAAMFFSANEPPRISEESDAIGDRLYPIEMPYRFVDDDAYNPNNEIHKKKTPGVSQKLLEDERAMEGLLLLTVKHAQELIESNGQYSMPEGPRERREIYEAAADPIRRFALEYLEQGDKNDVLLKDDVYTVYNDMCDVQNERAASADGFKRQISQQVLIDLESTRSRNITPGDSRDRCWRYVRFNEDAKELMSTRLITRYFGDDAVADDDDEDDDNTLQDENAAFGSTPIAQAAQSLTGYVTVTAEIATTRRLGDDDGGVKAVLKDESGAMDIVAWENPHADRLEDLEGSAVAIHDVEVTEYEGKRQLSPVEGLTEIDEIQMGAGYSPSEETDTKQNLLGNGSVPDDATDINADAQRLASIVENNGSGMSKSELIVEATNKRDLMDPDRAETAIEKAIERGYLINGGDVLESNK